MFTNIVTESDEVLDKLIQNFIFEEDFTSFGMFDVEKFMIFKIPLENNLFSKYLDITVFLIANCICNKIKDINEIMAILASSSINYLFELIQFSAKCEAFIKT